MKRTIIIAMCCLAVLFAGCKKEKPYDQFIGEYAGSGIINGTMSVLTFNQEFSDVAIPIKISLSAGDADNKIVLTYINEELSETYTATGTITNNDVDFDPVEVNTMIDNYAVNASLDMSGSLTGKILTLNGAVTGGGTFTDGGLQLPYTIQGTMTGTVTKIVEEHDD